MTKFHSSLKKFADANPAFVLSFDALRALLFTNFEKTARRLDKKSVPIEGFPEIEARFIGSSVNPNECALYPSRVNGFVVVEVAPDFTATIALHVAKNKNLEFSRIDIEVSNLKFRVTASAPNLLLGAPDFDVRGDIGLSKTRQKALKDSNVNVDDVMRIEGAMAYVMPRRIVASALSTISSINLAERFTAFELRGDWTLYLVDCNVVILPSGGIIFKDDVGCPIKDSAPGLSTKVDGMQIDSETNNGTYNEAHYSSPITFEGVTVPLVRKVRNEDIGFAALYAPKPIWDARFKKVLPGIVYQEKNNGFIGYDLEFTVGLKYVNLEIDLKQAGMVIEFEVVVSGTVFLTVDVPCVGRSDLGYVRFSCETSNLGILLSFVLQPNGKLVLESQINQLKTGKVDATVRLFSRWLVLAGGKSAVTGFITDYVLKRVIEHNLPFKIRDAIKQELNSKNFELLDFEELAMFTSYGFNVVTFSGDEDSVLVGLKSDG